MPIIDLSHAIFTGMAQYPGDPVPARIHHVRFHEKDRLQASAVELSCHVGTHIDTPFHFLDGRPGLERIPIEKFLGKGLVLSAPAAADPEAIPPSVLDGKALSGVDYLILRTGWEKHFGTPRYYEAWPYLSPELARLLTLQKLKGVGLDTPSSDRLNERLVHDLFAAAGMINVENLANLQALPDTPFDFMAFPLRLAGSEASPVRAVAIC